MGQKWKKQARDELKKVYEPKMGNNQDFVPKMGKRAWAELKKGGF